MAFNPFTHDQSPLTHEQRDRMRANFPWPGQGSIRRAIEVLREERERREANARQLADDLGLPGVPVARPMTEEDYVLYVIWALRGDR